ncbi:MAG: HNH endonuclease [Phenylobacterium sp.]|uniref:HNH endonuclease n=1 Tax=Phenylobacterium sp. TaxID=1871053 RepID=UPI0027261547|nr:helix-turn-helix domain-containing protein [Phenylobacterium sp.]MDO8912202.1 HNH endonuclease [Phenylobacterium sp.]MDP2012323.1 HNH endonuclease [Phenylobacterium sp.]
MGADDVRAARALLQWSQADLAKAAGVGVSTIADFEKGTRTPIANNLSATRRAFEVAGVTFTPTGPTIYSELSLYILTQTGGTEMRFRYAAEGATAVQDVVSVFGTTDGNTIELDAVQSASPALKGSIDKLVERHGGAVPQLNKLKQIIGRLADGEYFLLLPAQPETSAGRLEVERFLHGLNHPDEKPEGDELFGVLLTHYDIANPRTDRLTVIGKDLLPRRCRFCNRTSADGATFKKAAHVIPTALGNDHLKSAQECDDCNEYFGCDTEPSLIAMLDIQRVFLGTQGRGKVDGRPKLWFGEDVLVHDGSKVNITAQTVRHDPSGALTVELGKGASLTPSAVYRALTKMVLSVVADDQLPFLKETINWVRHTPNTDRLLPKVATAVVFLPPDPSAQLTVYTRRAPHPRLPHIVGEFRLGCYMYVFAVPFSQQDEWDLVGYFDEEDFQATFKHYALAGRWDHQDLSRQSKVSMTPRLKFVPKTK